jgi:hypothetical protein
MGFGQYEALYDYQQKDPSDLALFKGCQIQVLEKLNADWWRGRDLISGREGIFPSNYVEPSKGGPIGMNPYPPQQIQYSSPSPFPPQAVSNYYQPQQMQHQPAQGEGGGEQQQQNQINPHLKKFGGKLGNAAIFGAGATLGSNVP